MVRLRAVVKIVVMDMAARERLVGKAVTIRGQIVAVFGLGISAEILVKIPL